MPDNTRRCARVSRLFSIGLRGFADGVGTGSIAFQKRYERFMPAFPGIDAHAPHEAGLPNSFITIEKAMAEPIARSSALMPPPILRSYRCKANVDFISPRYLWRGGSFHADDADVTRSGRSAPV